MENYHSLNEYKNINNIKLNLKFVVFLRTSIGLLNIWQKSLQKVDIKWRVMNSSHNNYNLI